MSDLLLAKIDQKLDVLGEQLARVEERLESAKQRGDRFEYRLDQIEERVNRLDLATARAGMIERAAWVLFAALLAVTVKFF
jgi:predicted  nucleic acid-binding Zn-ribbon protein